MRPALAFAALAALLSPALLPSPARAAPWFDAQDAALEEAFESGDLDEEDVNALAGDSGRGGPSGARPRGGERGAGASDVHDESWVSVVGFERSLLSGKSDLGAILVVGLALDCAAQGRVRRIGDDAGESADNRAAARPPPPAPGLPALARRCVAAAWRTAGLGTDDARLDAIAGRSRSSALLPETRLRAMRLWDDAAHATTVATTADTSYYDAVGANLVLEVRLTWRLDRLIYAGDEATFERLRLERQDARARLATRTLEVLFGWERDCAASAGGARADGTATPKEQAAAELRAAEAEATLDVLTGGWSTRDAP